MKGTTNRKKRIKRWMATAASIVIAATTTFASAATTTFASTTDTGVVESADYKFSDLKIASKEENRIKGDMDGDGCITASDASKILELYAYLSVGNEIPWLDTYIPDVNSNGSIEASDASLVLAAYAAMSVGKPITWPPVSESDTTTTPPTTTTPAETTTEATTTTTTKATTSTTTTGETTSVTTEDINVFKVGVGDNVRFVGDWWRVRSTMKLESDTNEVGRIYTNDTFKVIDLKPDYWYLIWVNSELYGYVRIIPEDAHNFQKIVQPTTTTTTAETTNLKPTETTTTKATTTTTSTTTTSTTTTTGKTTSVTTEDINVFKVGVGDKVRFVGDWWRVRSTMKLESDTNEVGRIYTNDTFKVIDLKPDYWYLIWVNSELYGYVRIIPEDAHNFQKIVQPTTTTTTAETTNLKPTETTTTKATTTTTSTTTTSTTTTTGKTTSATTTTTNIFPEILLKEITNEMELYTRPDLMLMSNSWWYYATPESAENKEQPVGYLVTGDIIAVQEKKGNIYKVLYKDNIIFIQIPMEKVYHFKMVYYMS